MGAKAPQSAPLGPKPSPPPAPPPPPVYDFEGAGVLCPTCGVGPALFILPEKRLNPEAIALIRRAFAESWKGGKPHIQLLDLKATVYQLVDGRWELLPEKESLGSCAKGPEEMDPRAG
jgi:hypothetical protein